MPKTHATEEHKNKKQVEKTVKIEVAQVDLNWEQKGKLFVAQYAHETLGKLGRNATHKWERDGPEH